jgi:hypothetical protein
MSNLALDLTKQLANLAVTGISIASSLICTWYKENGILREMYGTQGYFTERGTIIDAESNLDINNMKWNFDITGAPYTDPADNDRANPTGRLPTLIAIAIIIQKRRAKLGELSMQTLPELQTNEENSGIYSEKDSVLDAKFLYTTGFDYHAKLEGGFKSGGYPGPISLGVGDKLVLVGLTSDDYTKPDKTRTGVHSYAVGTVSWRLAAKKKSLNTEILEQENIDF